MSISDINKKKWSRANKTLIVYLAFTVFCFIFSYVYEHFSHGVKSNSMIYMFLYPLLGGITIFIILKCTERNNFYNRASYNLYNSAIACFTLGSCVKGVIEIYGTYSQYTTYYFYAGGVLLFLSIIVLLIQLTTE